MSAWLHARTSGGGEEEEGGGGYTIRATHNGQAPRSASARQSSHAIAPGLRDTIVVTATWQFGHVHRVGSPPKYVGDWSTTTTIGAAGPRTGGGVFTQDD